VTPPLSRDSRQELLAQWITATQGMAFFPEDNPRDRTSAESLRVVLEALQDGSETTADALCSLSRRAVFRALAVLRRLGVLCEERHRVGHSPRVRRSIHWEALRDWIATLPPRPVATTKAAPAPRVRRSPNQPAHRPRRLFPALPPSGNPALAAELAALGCSPHCLETSTLLPDKVRQLIDFYARSALLNEAGETVYAWSAGLLYRRIGDPALAYLGAKNWPDSVNKEWRQLRARESRRREQQASATPTTPGPEVDQASRHAQQLELRFSDVLRDTGEVLRRLMEVPDQSSYLLKQVRLNGVTRSTRYSVLLGLEQWESLGVQS